MRELLVQRDSDGLTFMMHAANSKGGTSRWVDLTKSDSIDEDEEAMAYGNQEEVGQPYTPHRAKSSRGIGSSGRNFLDIANAESLGIPYRSSTRNFNLARRTRTSEEGGEHVDRSVPVVKAAIALLRDALWKEDVSPPNKATSHSLALPPCFCCGHCNRELDTYEFRRQTTLTGGLIRTHFGRVKAIAQSPRCCAY